MLFLNVEGILVTFFFSNQQKFIPIGLFYILKTMIIADTCSRWKLILWFTSNFFLVTELISQESVNNTSKIRL